MMLPGSIFALISFLRLLNSSTDCEFAAFVTPNEMIISKIVICKFFIVNDLNVCKTTSIFVKHQIIFR